MGISYSLIQIFFFTYHKEILHSQKYLTIKYRKAYKLKLPDSIIAATSSYLDIPLITADVGFKRIEELNLFFCEL